MLFNIQLSSKIVTLKYIKNSYYLSVILAFTTLVIVLFNYISHSGFAYLNFDLNKVYELRRSNYAVVTNSGIFGYLNSWVAKISNIFLLVIFLNNKKYIIALFFIIIQVLLFGLSGHKGTLFSLFIVFGFFIFKDSKKISIYIIYGIIVIITLSLLLYKVTNNIMLPSILVRRVFFVPADLNYVYFEFFSNNDFVLWTNGILKNLGTYPYSKEAVFLIGTYLGHSQMAANTGIYGSGFMHMGVYGIFIYTILLAYIFNLINQFKNIPNWMLNVIVIMPILSAFISSDFFTVLLTHGFLFSILILYLYNSKEEKKV
jgi:hypothetical protein